MIERRSDVCIWVPAKHRWGFRAERGGFYCDQHGGHQPEPTTLCVRATCLVCQAGYPCERHMSNYERYQGNTATWLAGALSEVDLKLDQLRELARSGDLEEIRRLLLGGAPQ